MKKDTVVLTEQDLRAAMNEISNSGLTGTSPLADRLVERLFGDDVELSQEGRIKTLENKVRELTHLLRLTRRRL